MNEFDYWQKQTAGKPLFPAIEWSKPERKSQAGKLGIIGGNKLGLRAPAEAYQTAVEMGVGHVCVLLPNSVKRLVPPTLHDVIFAADNPSGGLAADAAGELKTLGTWADGLLLIGDAGRNAETAVLYETFIQDYDGPLTVTRDGFDLLKNSAQQLVERPDTLLVLSFAQAQKLFQAVYYPKMLAFSMQLTQAVEALHKFTITYPIHLMVLHEQQLIVASGGRITTTAWEAPMAIWTGTVATKAAAAWLWNPAQPLQAVTASLLFA